MCWKTPSSLGAPHLAPLLLVLVAPAAALLAPPDLDLLASAWQPVDQAVIGAPSVTNSWGSVLASTANVLGFNALELPPFSSGWSAESLYGWPTDSASLYVDGAPVAPSFSQWTPYSVRRNGSAVARGLAVETELRWVFEAQALLLEAIVSAPAAAAFSLSVDLRLPLRYFARARDCSSWHYPSMSVPCCWNWFPPEAPPRTDSPAVFVPSWHDCPGAPTAPSSAFSTLIVEDSLSAATSAYSFPGSCGPRDGSASGTVLDLTAPDTVDRSVASWRVTLDGVALTSARLRIALVFSNASSDAAIAQAARALADAFEPAWADAKADWQSRFDEAFDPELRHFSGSLPLLSSPSNSSSNLSSIETLYYASVVSLLANERTNYPPSLPDNATKCLRPRRPTAASESFEVLLPSTEVPRRGLLRYLVALPLALANGTSVLAIPLVRGSSFSGGGSSADYDGGRRASKLMAAAVDGLVPRELLQEVGAPWRMFVTGGGMNATSNIFYWDYQYSAALQAMLEPATLLRQLLLWTSSVDPDTMEASQWSFWGYDYVAQRGIGNYYAANDMTLFEIVDALLRLSGNVSLLGLGYDVGPFPNGSSVHTTVYNTAVALATHWSSDARYNVSGYLADYGAAANLLECVPTYIHRVAGVNAANAYMSRTLAAWAEHWAGDVALAERLRSDASGIAADILARLYVAPSPPGSASGGYFKALFPNGTACEVRHVMDFVYTSLYLELPRAVAAEMDTFVRRELLVPHWMRALSLNDSAAPYSNRSDHGPSGAYVGWPPLTLRSLAAHGDYLGSLSLLQDMAFVVSLGPFGQAIEVRPPGDPYKPMPVTLYNEMAGASFADTTIRSIFGFSPSLDLPGMPPATTPLVDATAPRGFDGVLSGVQWRGARYDVVSRAAQGLSLRPHAL